MQSFTFTGLVWPRGQVEVWLYSSMTAALEGSVWSAASSGRNLSPESPDTHFTGGRMGPGPVWTDGKSRPHGDSFTDRPARSLSLYRLSYPANILHQYLSQFYFQVILVNTNSIFFKQYKGFTLKNSFATPLAF